MQRDESLGRQTGCCREFLFFNSYSALCVDIVLTSVSGAILVSASRDRWRVLRTGTHTYLYILFLVYPPFFYLRGPMFGLASK